MQSRLVSGTTLNFTTYVADYLPTDGWVLKFRLIPRTTGTPIDITTTQDATDSTLHRAQVTAATTAGWTAGEYSWASWVELGTEKYAVSGGTITVAPNPIVASTLDSRSAARIALDNVRAVIAGNASRGILSYTIAGRSLERYSMADLLKLESSLRAEVQREENCAAMAAGLPSRRKTYVRLNLA
jgi:hypothetical protein